MGRKKSLFFSAALVGLSLLVNIRLNAQTIEKFGFHFQHQKTRQTTIPFDLVSNLIVIPVTVNEDTKLNFILDTGVRTAILTDDLHVQGLPRKNDRLIQLLGNGNKGKVEAFVSNGISMSLPGGVQSKTNAMLVLKEDYLKLDRHLGFRVHGILGYELFSRFVVEIDYYNKLLILHNPKRFKPRRRFRRIPITIEDTKPYISSELNVYDTCETAELKLMVDTGASHSLMLDRRTDSSLFVPERNIYGYLGRGLSGDIYGALARINYIGLGDTDYGFEEVITSFPEESSLTHEIQTDAEEVKHGTIGGGMLKRFSVIFDYAGGYMYLNKNRRYRDPFTYNMSGLEFIVMGPMLRTIVVSEVAMGSPADEAGVLPGDMVLRANHMSVPDLTLGYLGALMQTRPNKKIKLKLFRDGEVLKKKFRLEEVL